MKNTNISRKDSNLIYVLETHFKGRLNRQKSGKDSHAKPVKEIANNREGMQLSFFQLDDPVLSQIRDEIINIDIDNLTPIEALNKLSEIRKHLGI